MPAQPSSGSSQESQNGNNGRAANVADFTFAVGSLTRDQLKVTRFVGREGLSRLFEFRIEFSTEEQVDAAAQVGQACHLEIATGDTARLLHGMVRRFEYVGGSHRTSYFTCEVVPKHWVMTRRLRSRVFTEHVVPSMTAPDIIKKVLEDAGFQEDRDFKFALQGSYAAADLVVQYRESEWDFIARLMEEEGIFFYFEHTDEGHVLTFGDTDTAYKTHGDSGLTVPFRELSGLDSPDRDEFVFELRESHEMQIGKVSYDAYDFQQPSKTLWNDATGSQFTSLMMVDFRDNYIEPSAGQTRATARLGEFQCRANTQGMRGTVRRFIPGYKFTLEDHPEEARNGEYLCFELTHVGQQSQSGEQQTETRQGLTYQCEISTMRATVVYRPSQVTPRPRIHGAQTALVVGASGEEIYTDEYGRVKIKFYWDAEGPTNENSSCWVRCSQVMAGGRYGAMMLPRIGQEVIVNFLEGDPNRPIVTGRVYNNDCMPPYTLPDDKNTMCLKSHRTGGGGCNELRFIDTAGEEQVLLFAQKDMHIRSEEQTFHTVKKKLHLKVDEDRMSAIAGTDSLTVGGDRCEGVTGSLNVKVDGNVLEEFGAGHSEKVSGERYIKCGTLVVEADSGISLKVGGNFVSITSAGIFIKGSLVGINSGGAASPSTMAASRKDAASAEEAEKPDPGADVAPSRPQRTPGGTTPGDKPYEPPPPPPPPPETTTWIEFQLVDDLYNPISNEPYQVWLPDTEAPQEGVTDGEGMCRFEQIKPGPAKICFPQRENNEWVYYRSASPGDAPAGGGGGGGQGTSTGQPVGPSGGSLPGGSQYGPGGGGSPSYTESGGED